MSELLKLPNIGERIEQLLIDAGIDSIQALEDAGSEEAFMRIKTRDSQACLSMLCALEGAIERVRWHDLSQRKKDELRLFYQNL